MINAISKIQFKPSKQKLHVPLQCYCRGTKSKKKVQDKKEAEKSLQNVGLLKVNQKMTNHNQTRENSIHLID